MGTTSDLVVIGSGPGGYRAAVLAALRGLKVVIVERGTWGGCCLNRGCVPKKAWHHTAQLLAAQRRFASRGVRGQVHGDLKAAWHHQREMISGIRDGYTDYLERLGVRRVSGDARLIAPGRVEVTSQQCTHTLHSGAVILATGSTPSIPDHLGTIPGRVITTDTLFERVPPSGSRVAIIGSGVAATELAFILAMFGREITWLGRSRFLRRLPFSDAARRTLSTALASHGVHLSPQSGDIRIIDRGNDGLRVISPNGGSCDVDWVCLATGRDPATGSLGLEGAGVEIDDQGFIQRDEHLQTSVEGVYAIGDCAAREMTANRALADAALAIENLLGENRHRHQPETVPTVVYSAVELARVGLDELAAEDLGLEPAVGFAAFATNPSALGRGDPEGFARILADMDSGRLIGGEVVGSGAGEMIHLLSLAPNRDTALAWLAGGPYNHPTMGEELRNASETLAARWGLGKTVFGL